MGLGMYVAHIWQVYSNDQFAPELAALASAPNGNTAASLKPATFEPEDTDVEKILDNAVFEPTRERPQPEPEPEPEQQPEVESGPQPLQITILGIVIEGDSGVVLYKSGQGGAPKQIMLGDKIGGWKLVELAGVFAVFEQGGEEVRIQLPLD